MLNNIIKFLNNKFFFRISYLFLSIAFVTIMNYIPYIKLLNKLVIFWGIYLVFVNILNLFFKKRRIYIFQVFLYLFLSLTLIFTLIKYPTLENIKIWFVNVLIFIVIFSIDTDKSKKDLKFELNFISYFYICITFFLSLFSIFFIEKLGKQVEFTVQASNFEKIITLTGLYNNENALGISAALSFIICLYLFFTSNSKNIKVLLVINCIIQFITVFIANGRSAYLLFLSLIFTIAFVFLKNTIVRCNLVIVPVVIFFTWLNFNRDKIYLLFTGREDLWATACILIKKYPLLGVGNTNMIPFMKEVQVNYLRGLEFGGTHNIYIQIATTHGLISTLLILLFIISTFIFIINKLDCTNIKTKFIFSILLSLFVGVLLINCMESNLIYIISFISLIFWIYTSYIISLLDNDDKN